MRPIYLRNLETYLFTFCEKFEHKGSRIRVQTQHTVSVCNSYLINSLLPGFYTRRESFCAIVFKLYLYCEVSGHTARTIFQLHDRNTKKYFISYFSEIHIYHNENIY